MFFSKLSLSLIPPGRDNPFYSIGSYYGSRDKEYFSRNAILNDNLTTFPWVTFFDEDRDQNFLYFVDSTKNALFSREIATGTVSLVAGFTDQAGYRDGDLLNSLFNHPSAVKVWYHSKMNAQLERRKQIIILKDTSQACLYVDHTNYTKCQDLSTSNDIIDPSRIKTIYFPYDPELDLKIDRDLEDLTFDGNILIVVDTDNHCIRMVNLKEQITSTFAGQCGIAGFKDGPQGVNLFNTPISFGIDALGNMYVLDSGNHFIRFINPYGEVSTMIHGSCRQSTVVPTKLLNFGLTQKYVACYRNWIKTSGEPDDHIWQRLSETEKCFDNDILCEGYVVHPVIAKNATFAK